MGNGRVQQTNHSSPLTRGIAAPTRSAMDAGAVASAPRFDHDFSKVKVHADSSIQLRRQLGTAKTTAPIATVSPRAEMLKQLTDETTLFSNAQAITDWVLKKSPAPAPATGTTTVTVPPPFTFTAGELLADKVLVKKIKPAPKKEEDLTAMLDLLVSYGIMERTAVAGPPGPGGLPTAFTLKRDPKTQQPDQAAFVKDKTRVKQFRDKFERRAENPDPLDPVTETSVLPKEWAAGAKSEIDRESAAEAGLTKAKENLEKLKNSGATDEKTLNKIKAAEAAVTVAEKEKVRAQGFHTFASDVANLFARLRKINTSWRAGTYYDHFWGEYSADIFLTAGLTNVKDIGDYSGNYWDRKVVRQFFDDLNTVSEEDDPTTGKFAWKAVYNDIPLAGEINKKYGAGRVLQKENHGPDGKKLHIHLDLRPIKQRLDTKSGFEISKGRIKILP